MSIFRWPSILSVPKHILSQHSVITRSQMELLRCRDASRYPGPAASIATIEENKIIKWIEKKVWRLFPNIYSSIRALEDYWYCVHIRQWHALPNYGPSNFSFAFRIRLPKMKLFPPNICQLSTRSHLHNWNNCIVTNCSSQRNMRLCTRHLSKLSTILLANLPNNLLEIHGQRMPADISYLIDQLMCDYESRYCRMCCRCWAQK